jgi:hypothetical protein
MSLDITEAAPSNHQAAKAGQRQRRRQWRRGEGGEGRMERGLTFLSVIKFPLFPPVSVSTTDLNQELKLVFYTGHTLQGSYKGTSFNFLEIIYDSLTQIHCL